MKRIPWSLEESVILHDAYMRISNKQTTKADAIIEVSQKLRKIAENTGMEIDEKFRNTNGITMQLSIMEYVVTNEQRERQRVQKRQHANCADGQNRTRLEDGQTVFQKRERQQRTDREADARADLRKLELI